MCVIAVRRPPCEALSLRAGHDLNARRPVIVQGNGAENNLVALVGLPVGIHRAVRVGQIAGHRVQPQRLRMKRRGSNVETTDQTHGEP